MNPKYSRCSECGFYEPNMKADYGLNCSELGFKSIVTNQAAQTHSEIWENALQKEVLEPVVI